MHKASRIQLGTFLSSLTIKEEKSRKLTTKERKFQSAPVQADLTTEINLILSK